MVTEFLENPSSLSSFLSLEHGVGMNEWFYIFIHIPQLRFMLIGDFR